MFAMFTLAQLKQRWPVNPHQLNLGDLEDMSNMLNAGACKIAKLVLPIAKNNVQQADCTQVVKRLGMYCYHLHKYLSLKNTNFPEAEQNRLRAEAIKPTLDPTVRWD